MHTHIHTYIYIDTYIEHTCIVTYTHTYMHIHMYEPLSRMMAAALPIEPTLTNSLPSSSVFSSTLISNPKNSSMFSTTPSLIKGTFTVAVALPGLNVATNSSDTKSIPLPVN